MSIFIVAIIYLVLATGAITMTIWKLNAMRRDQLMLNIISAAADGKITTSQLQQLSRTVAVAQNYGGISPRQYKTISANLVRCITSNQSYDVVDNSSERQR